MVIVWWWSGGGGRQDFGRADEQRAEVSGARLVREAGGDSRTHFRMLDKNMVKHPQNFMFFRM